MYVEEFEPQKSKRAWRCAQIDCVGGRTTEGLINQIGDPGVGWKRNRPTPSDAITQDMQEFPGVIYNIPLIGDPIQFY
jgi:hypothetical protein